MMSDQESLDLDAQIALAFVDRAVFAKQGKHLTDVQRIVFLGCWDGQSYKEIHHKVRTRYELVYLMRDVGPELWRVLSRVFAKSINKKNLRGPIESSFHERPVMAPDAPADNDPAPIPDLSRHDWGNAPDVPLFYGHWQELETLERGILLGQHRLVVISGMGQVGKTTLAVKLAERIREQFDFLIWRSLDSPVKMVDLVQDLMQFLANQPRASGTVPQLLNLLRHNRCLIILDGIEVVLQPGVHDGSYQPGYEDYRDLFRPLGQSDHQSCFILTTREQLKEVQEMAESSLVCVRKLAGLGEIAMQEFLAARRILGSEHHWREVFRRYGGNPFVLAQVCRLIQHVFQGDLSHFLTQTNLRLPAEVRQLLQAQLTRLSDLERRIIEQLTQSSTPVTMQKLAEMLPLEDLGDLVEGLESLKRRSLVDVNKTHHYLLNSLVREIVSKR
jgi:NB-ARC domain